MNFVSSNETERERALKLLSVLIVWLHTFLRHNEREKAQIYCQYRGSLHEFFTLYRESESPKHIVCVKCLGSYVFTS